MWQFVGRSDALSQLAAAYDAVAGAGRLGRAPAGLALVTGEAGMGKTALLTRFAADIAARGGRPVWGTCWDADQAPALWPWTQVVRTVLDDGPRGAVDPELAVVVPELGPATVATGAADAARLRVFDAVGRLLARSAGERPLAVIIDDLQWTDLSTVDLMRFLTVTPYGGAVLLVGAYRPDELAADTAAALAGLAAAGQPVPLRGLSPAEVGELVEAAAGPVAAARWTDGVYERSGGHPFFARELSQVLASGGGVAGVPAAVQEAIARRLSRLSTAGARLLEAAAVAGPELLPDVLAEVTGTSALAVTELVGEAAAIGLVTGNDPVRFGHDLYRESIYSSLTAAQRPELHRRVAEALVHRYERGGRVFPAELARHFAAAVPVAGPAPALAWARRAAGEDAARFAFAEAAGHLARVRGAIADAGVPLAAAELIDLLAAEADAALRAGDAGRSRELLDTAWVRAVELGDPARLGAVARGLDRIGARFSMPRTHLVDVLERARGGLAGSGTAAEAEVTAALARQLQHSIPRDRPRARPLAQRSVAIARELDDPTTLASCLLAQHDTLWVPGTAAERERIAAEIAQLAQAAGDAERHAQGLLLTATAQLEAGSPAFRATLAEYGYLTEALRQPRHDYLLRTRQAALALLDGDIDTGDRLSVEAAALGEAVGDTDTGNVRMSQRLEVIRARAEPAELRAMAAEAVAWWVGAPAHAHAVAAGFLARAGDLDGARRELDTVLALPDWRTDRSYLWSIFVAELATAAIAVNDRPLCTQLLADLLPVAEQCAVNGALVCFMGAHAHRVGLLYAALDQPEPARQWLDRALETHRTLGARAWEAETKAALSTAAAGPAEETALHKVGDLWQARYRGRVAYVRDTKGMRDIAVLLSRPGVDLPAVELAAGADARTVTAADPAGGTAPVLDGTALRAYRRRIAELDEDLAAAQAGHDLGRQGRASDERERLLAELRRATRPGGAARTLGPTAAERARKAVTGRIRDAIRRIQEVLPEFGAHLDRAIRTGTLCRYDPER